ncbi:MULTISPECIES: hypothetical protein [Rheinheimera]|uniref:DUF2939 domain-containing protein n=1 Tax=Rheinheimera marina TaxID=1774958 RepID=A0ABV9JKC0_9GAMM
MKAQLHLLLQSAAVRWLSYGAAVVLGVMLYQAKPWLSFWLLPEPMTSSQLSQAQRFEKANPQAAVVLDAFINLRALVRQEKELRERFAPWERQERDEGWAEATEYLLAHLAVSTSNNELRILASECRNTLCQVRLMAPVPMGNEFTAKILQFAKVLKAAELEYQDMETEPGAVLLHLKANKDYKFAGAVAASLQPAERAVWEQEVLQWYKN